MFPSQNLKRLESSSKDPGIYGIDNEIGQRLLPGSRVTITLLLMCFDGGLYFESRRLQFRVKIPVKPWLALYSITVQYIVS